MEKEFYPQLDPKVAIEPTKEELVEIAKRLVAIWDNPPEVTESWEKDGMTVPEGTSGAVEIKTTRAHLKQGFRIRKALEDSNLTPKRKKELIQVKFKLKKADIGLFDERDKLIANIDEEMTGDSVPENKAELDSRLNSPIIPVTKLTRKYMDYKVQKANATFAAFKATYEAPAEL